MKFRGEVWRQSLRARIRYTPGIYSGPPAAGIGQGCMAASISPPTPIKSLYPQSAADRIPQ